MAGSNSHGNGSIVQLDKGKDGRKPKSKCRKWRLVVSLGKDPLTGRYPQKSRTFNGTYSEAKRALREFDDEVRGNRTVRKNVWTFHEYMEHFMEVRKESGEIAAQTLATDRTRLNALDHIIAATRMQDITPTALESAYDAMRKGRSRSGRCLSCTYVSEINEVVTLLMDVAVKERVIGANPCKLADVPARDTKEKRALSDSQISEFLGRLDPTKSEHCALILYLTQGLRRGEACGLSREDLDFSARTTYVHHNYDVYGNLKEPKTGAGVRMLPMSDYTYQALRARVDSLVELFSTGTDPDGNDLNEHLVRLSDGSLDLAGDVPLVCDAYGKRSKPQHVSEWWKRHRGRLGLEGWTLHELRHTFLTVAARNGVHPSVMQHLAGHTTSRITMDIYTHVNMEQKRAAMDAMQGAFKTGLRVA